MSQVATGQFTGLIPIMKNRHIPIAISACIDIVTELVGNDEFKSRSGTDDSTRDHFVQLIVAADKQRRLITYNAEGHDIKAIIDVDSQLEDSLKPLSSDGIQLTSLPDFEIPWRFDGTDPNIPLWGELHFRNGIGGVFYANICQCIVAWTRLESRNRAAMITVNDSIRMYTYLQSFHDLCVRLMGSDNQKDLAQPLATDEPTNVVPPNRKNETVIRAGTSLQNSERDTTNGGQVK